MPKQVVVIGSGAAGLVTARELSREGFEVTIYEQSRRIGGVWVYTEETDADPLGQDPDRRIHSSLYDALKTNIPRDLMGFLDYTFDSQGGGDDAWPRYPHHTQVLEYLEGFAVRFALEPMIQFETRVTRVAADPEGTWQVETDRGDTRTFDAVAVCNGHYAAARVPQVAGMHKFKGLAMHSHNYRHPEPFAGRTIAVMGTAASGADLARDLSRVAAHVYWCGDVFEDKQQLSPQLTRMPLPHSVDDDGALRFEATDPVKVEVFMFCTGYHYEFPFVDETVVSVDENRVFPLYLDIIPPPHPSLGFIGLPYLVIPFPLFECQATWFARALGGRFRLPGRRKMTDWVKGEIKRRGKNRHYHRLGSDQVDYMNELRLQCGEPPLPAWFGELMAASRRLRLQHPDDFRTKPLPRIAPTVVNDGV